MTLSALATRVPACTPSMRQARAGSERTPWGLWHLTRNGDSTRAFPVVLAVVCIFLATSLEARITQVKIHSTSAPGADGYVTIAGKAYGKVDPQHRLNTIIQDIQLAPRNERGIIEYSTEFRIARSDRQVVAGTLNQPIAGNSPCQMVYLGLLVRR